MTFCPFNDEDCVRRCLSESGHLTFRVSEKSESTSNISGQEGLFSFPILRSKMGSTVQDTPPPLLCCFSNIEEVGYILFSRSKIECVGSHS